jgi:hypothetical protein
MKIVLACFVSISVGVVKGQSIQSSNEASVNRGDKSADEIVYQKIFDLPEMKKYFKDVDSIYSNKKHAIIIINSRPTHEEPFYWIQVGINDDDQFRPRFNFYVYQKDYVVKFYDTVNDEVLTLEKWRKKKVEH